MLMFSVGRRGRNGNHSLHCKRRVKLEKDFENRRRHPSNLSISPPINMDELSAAAELACLHSIAAAREYNNKAYQPENASAFI